MTIVPRRLSLSLGLIAVGGLVWAAGASAKTLGSLAPPNLGGCSSCEGFQAKTDAGEPKYRVPKGPTGLWTITAWSAQGGSSGDATARVHVYRKTATHGQYEIVAQSQLETVPADTHPLFSTSLDVQSGDLLGLQTTGEMPMAYDTPFTGDLVKIPTCNPGGVGALVGHGTSCKVVNSPGGLINILAELTPR